MPVQPPGSHQGVVQDVGAVGGCQHDDVIRGAHSCQNRTRGGGLSHLTLHCRHSGLEAGDGVHSSTQSQRVCTAPFGAAEAECPLQLGTKSGRNLPGDPGQSLVTMDTLKSPFHLLSKSWLKTSFSPAYCHTWKLLQLEPRTEPLFDEFTDAFSPPG